VNVATSALLCIEEPELYLHPHARRLISDRLTDFIADKNQVIVTTHSAEFLRSGGEDVNVIALSRENNGVTTSISVNLKDYSRLLVHEFSSELFFADKVIICEGFDDFVVRAVARELFPKQLDSRNVSVISAGGKDNFAGVARLVMNLGIKCYVIADFDYLLRDSSEDRRQYGDVKAHHSVASLDLDFFAQPCIYGDKGKGALKGLQALRDRIRKADESLFYLAKCANEVSEPNLLETLQKLRRNGVGILSGEIETFCKDGFVSPKNKLNLNRTFDLNARLASGEKISDIFDVTEIAEVLTSVLK
jgi:predicted ATP-dependent endonuclease of OLD family